jgi:hypothetical protein
MKTWFQEYRDFILFFWGITLLTFIIIFHVVTDYAAYLILGAAIGLPLVVGGAGGKKKDD